jgi:hypothetical protein
MTLIVEIACGIILGLFGYSLLKNHWRGLLKVTFWTIVIGASIIYGIINHPEQYTLAYYQEWWSWFDSHPKVTGMIIFIAFWIVLCFVVSILEIIDDKLPWNRSRKPRSGRV